MRNFQDTFETHKRSFISVFSICMTVPLTANMMSEVCKDTEIEPKLMPLSGEELEVSGNEGNRYFST